MNAWASSSTVSRASTASETAWIGVESPAAAVALLGHMRSRMGEAVSAFELIRRSLRNKTPAVTKVHDVSLQLNSKHVLVWASSTGVVEEVHGALELGLETRLLPCTPHQQVSPSVLETLSPTPELFGSVS